MPPEDKVSYWENGMAVYQKESENFLVRVGFEDSDKDNILIDVELVNLSTESLLIEPDNFKVSYIKSEEEFSQYAAINTEETLLKLDKAIARVWASEKNNQYLAIAGAMSDGMNMALRNPIDQTSNNIAYGTFDAQRTASHGAQLSGQKGFYKNYAIRKTTLFPDTYIKGKIVFPREEKAEKLLLTIPIGDESFEFELFQFTFNRW